MPRPNLRRKLSRAVVAIVVAAALCAGLWFSNAGRVAAAGVSSAQPPVERTLPRGGGEAPTSAESVADPKARAEFAPGEALVRFRSEKRAASAETYGAQVATGEEGGGNAQVRFSRFEGSDIVPGLRLARFEAADTLAAVATLNARPDVLYAEPNYVWRAALTPNDPDFTAVKMHGLKKIDAETAWGTTTGSNSVVVAVIDEGVDFSHPDLAANKWTNPGESGGGKESNGVDDDGNGFVDDVNGWDFFHDDKTVFDAPDGDNHGTHVAGTVGAKGNNGVGVTGVNWDVSIMPLKVLGPGGGYTSDIIDAYNYVRMMKGRGINVRVTNNSYTGGGRSQAALDAINALNGAGVLFVAAAGNSARDNFNYPTYPASYDAPNLIAVAATDSRNDSTEPIAGFSNFGSRAVSMGAPGVLILSTLPGDKYDWFSGTSMASPHVAGAAALLLAANPNLSVAQLRGALVYSGDRIAAVQNNTTTGRRLNASAAVASALEDDSTPPATVALNVASQSGRSITLSFTAPGDDGTTGTAADYDFFFVNQTTNARILLPTNTVPALGGTQQSVTVNAPFLASAGTIELRAYDNRGSVGTSSVAVNIPAGPGSDPFVVTTAPAQSLTSGGTRLSLDGDDKYLSYALPFSFPFYGQPRTSLTVSTNGALYFSTPPRRASTSGDPDEVAADAGSSVEAMQGQAMIAGLWDDLEIKTTKRSDAGIFVVTEAGRVVFRYQATTYPTLLANGSSRAVGPVNFEIELRPDGTVVTRYGGDNQNLFPVVGASGGEPWPYHVASHTSENALRNLTNAQAVNFAPRPAAADTLGCNQMPATINFNGTVNGSLATGDCVRAGGQLYDAYTFSGTAGQLVNITLISPPAGQTGGFDTYLYLLKPGETSVTPGTIQNDDGEGSGSTEALDSAIVAVLPATGTYTVLATSKLAGQTGPYSLSLRGGCAATAVGANNTPTAGTLAAADCQLPDGTTVDVYSFSGAAQQRVAVAMQSSAVDSFLRLLSSDGFTELGRDDDGFDTNDVNNRDARIPQNSGFVTLPSAGTYHVLAGSRTPGAFGNYQLTVFTPELSVGMASSPASLTAGGDITYDITVSNAAGPAVTNVTVTDTLPAGVELVSAVPSQGTCSGTTTVTCNLGNMAAGAAATARIIVRALTAGTKTNTATVAAAEPEVNTSNNSAQQSTTVLAGINGRVTNSANSQPLAGVTVTLSGPQSATATTDSAGNYSFVNLAPGGNYTVTPSLTNFSFAPASRTFGNLQTNATGDFVGTLNTHTISGRVSNAASNALAGVTVTLSGSQSAATQTDDNGNYSFANLAAGGNYTVTPSRANYNFTPAARTFNNLTANQTADFTGALASYTISGRVADGGGAAVASVTVTLSGSQSATISTDNDGQFSFAVAAEGTYTVTPSKAFHTFNPASRGFPNLGGNAVSDFTATAAPASIQFSAAAYAAGEGAGSFVVTVTRTGNTASAVSVNYATVAGGTAAAGSDYAQASGTLNFAPDDVSETFSVAILEDGAVEGDETVNLQLSAPGGNAALASPSSAVLTIQDNDTCSYTLGPGASQQFGPSGSQGTVTVTAPQGCAWTAASNSDFITLISGAPGNGDGTVTFSLAANPGSAARSGTLTVAGQTYTVNQSGAACVYTVNPEGFEFPAAGGQGSFQMISPQGCAWSVSAIAPWITITAGATGSGTGTVSFTVAQNFGPQRTGQILRTDDSFINVSQAAGGSAFSLDAATFEPGEGAGRVMITVTRSGDLSRPASVTFSTVDDPAPVPCATLDGKAYARCDYATTIETLAWAAGDAQPKTVNVPLIDDGRAEGNETFQLKLSDPQGGILFGSGVSTLTIVDNDAAEGVNPISGNQFFVRMQYLDFLSREPEPSEPWTGVLDRCPDVNNTSPTSPSAKCDRLHVSQSFFRSPEFSLKGFYTYLFYRAAFDRRPAYDEIVPDMRSLAGRTGQEVVARRAAYPVSFAQRPEFRSLYDALDNRQYVAALLDRYGLQQITTEDPQQPEGEAQVTLTRQELVDRLGSGALTRAQVLRAVVQSSEVDSAEYLGAFVAMQYYGYLRRTPEEEGYQAWLRVIRQNPNNIRQMVNGFVNSREYRLRFGNQN